MIFFRANRIRLISGTNRDLILLLPFLVATVGLALQVAGLNWDITEHLQRNPGGDRLLTDANVFLSPTHSVLYSGVGITSMGAVMAGFSLLSNRKSSFSKFLAAPYKMLLIGCALQLVAGPADFWWHQTYGLDGLISPPHLVELAGMLVNAFSTVKGLSGVFHDRALTISSNSSSVTVKLMRMVLIPALANLWFVAVWAVLYAVLPLSKGERVDLNLAPIVAASLATALLPLIGSSIFMTATRLFGRFGASSAVAILVLIINIFACIVPSSRLTPLLPWYSLITIATVVIADAVMYIPTIRNRLKLRLLEIISCALIGSIFYVFYSPMISLTFAVLLAHPLRTIVVDQVSQFWSDMVTIVAITMAPAIGVSIFGARFLSKRFIQYLVPGLYGERKGVAKEA